MGEYFEDMDSTAGVSPKPWVSTPLIESRALSEAAKWYVPSFHPGLVLRSSPIFHHGLLPALVLETDGRVMVF